MLSSTIYTKISNKYKLGTPYVKVSGDWKKAAASYIKVNGEWKLATHK
jgi:hypothetical protein